MQGIYIGGPEITGTILELYSSSCVALSRLLNLSVPLLHHLSSRNNGSTHFIGLVMKIK